MARIAGAATPALSDAGRAIVQTDDGPVLCFRLGSGEHGKGLLLLGPRRSARESEAEIICGKVNAVVSDIFPIVRANRND